MHLEKTLRGHLLNLYHMALSDSQMDAKELEMLYVIAEEKGISKEEIDQVVIQPESINILLPETLKDKIESLYDLARIAWADGTVDASERKTLEVFCRKFGFREENTSIIVQFLLDEAEKGTDKATVFNIVNETT